MLMFADPVSQEEVLTLSSHSHMSATLVNERAGGNSNTYGAVGANTGSVD